MGADIREDMFNISKVLDLFFSIGGKYLVLVSLSFTVFLYLLFMEYLSFISSVAFIYWHLTPLDILHPVEIREQLVQLSSLLSLMPPPCGS